MGDLAPGPGVFLFFAGVPGGVATLTFGLRPVLPPGFVAAPQARLLSSTGPSIVEISVEPLPEPIAEPTSVVLVALGLALSARHRRRLRR